MSIERANGSRTGAEGGERLITIDGVTKRRSWSIRSIAKVLRTQKMDRRVEAQLDRER